MHTVTQPQTRRARRRTTAPRRGLSVVGVIGDLLVTAGVLVLLFVVWQLWIGDVIIGSQFKNEARDITESWAADPPPPPPATPRPPASRPRPIRPR